MELSAQDPVGKKADGCGWLWAAPPGRQASLCSEAVGRDKGIALGFGICGVSWETIKC